MLRDASPSRIKWATRLAFFSIPLSGFLTDIYLPSFPSMAKALDVSEHEIQATLTVYFLSYGIAQLFVGNLLDAFGRYKPRLIALAIVFLTSLGITQLHDIQWITAFRIVQGIAISLVVISTRAFFVDMYDQEQRKHYLSYFTIVWSCGPILAPFLGGYLEHYFNWQANFYFIAGYALLVLVLDLLISGETLAQFKKIKLREVVANYRLMLSHESFILGIVILGLSYSVVMVFNIAGPFVLENALNSSAVVIGYCTLILGFSWMVGGIVSKKMSSLDMSKRILYASAIQVVLCITIAILSMFSQNLYLFIAFAFLIHICSGFLYTIFFTQSMLTFPEHAGVAGGLIGGLVYVFTSLSSYLISTIGKIQTPADLGIRYVLIAALLLLLMCYVSRIYRKHTAT